MSTLSSEVRQVAARALRRRNSDAPLLLRFLGTDSDLSARHHLHPDCWPDQAARTCSHTRGGRALGAHKRRTLMLGFYDVTIPRRPEARQYQAPFGLGDERHAPKCLRATRLAINPKRTGLSLRWASGHGRGPARGSSSWTISQLKASEITMVLLRLRKQQCAMIVPDHPAAVGLSRMRS